MALFEGALGAACYGTIIEYPRFYLVHGPDDDVFRHGASYATLADLLQPCRVCALGFDEDSQACGSLPELAVAYNRRVFKDLEATPLASGEESGAEAAAEAADRGDVVERLVLIGYGLGAPVAHQMAVQLREADRSVALVLLDSEASWPPEERTDERLGGYCWLGGRAEAALLMCRALGAREFAKREVAALAEVAADGRGVDVDAREDLLMRTFWELAGRSSVTQSHFLTCVEQNGRFLDKLNTLAGDFKKDAVPFEGESLLLRAADSPEFSGVEATNAKLCSQLEVVQVPGNHYTMCQRTEAGLSIALPQSVSEFLLLRGFFGPEAQDRAAAARGATGGRLALDGFMEIVE